jgi:hypothetical protein
MSAFVRPCASAARPGEVWRRRTQPARGSARSTRRFLSLPPRLHVAPLLLRALSGRRFALVRRRHALLLCKVVPQAGNLGPQLVERLLHHLAVPVVAAALVAHRCELLL